MKYSVLLGIAVAVLLVLAACTSDVPCVKHNECVKPGNIGKCAKSICQFTPTDDKTCTTAEQCKKEGMTGVCTTKQCAYYPEITVAKAPVTQVKYFTDTEQSFGNSFKIATTLADPFDVNKDFVHVHIELSELAKDFSATKIKRLEIQGRDKQSRQELIIASKQTDKFLWQTGDSIDEDVRIQFPTSDSSGAFTDVVLLISYETTQTSGKDIRQRTDTIRSVLRNFDLNWEANTATACGDCDDKNELTIDTCDQNFFCKHEFKKNVCGNFVCEPTETKCTCKQDCGPCQGNAGTYVQYACKSQACVTQLIEPQKPITILDERSLNLFKLATRYTYKQPFNVKQDNVSVEVSLFDRDQSISQIKITTVQLFDGQNLLAEKNVKKILPIVGSKAYGEVSIPALQGVETELSLHVVISYEYLRETSSGSEFNKGSYDKQFDKLTAVAV